MVGKTDFWQILKNSVFCGTGDFFMEKRILSALSVATNSTAKLGEG